MRGRVGGWWRKACRSDERTGRVEVTDDRADPRADEPGHDAEVQVAIVLDTFSPHCTTKSDNRVGQLAYSEFSLVGGARLAAALAHHECRLQEHTGFEDRGSSQEFCDKANDLLAYELEGLADARELWSQDCRGEAVIEAHVAQVGADRETSHLCLVVAGGRQKVVGGDDCCGPRTPVEQLGRDSASLLEGPRSAAH